MLEKDFSYTGFIEQLLSVGRLSFTIEEIIEKTGYNRKIVQVSLSRLIQKKKVTLIRRGFYVIITPEFSAQATIPPILYIDDLMQYLKKEYYLSLLSAAALHGAAHQQPMLFFVTTEAPSIRNIISDKWHIVFNIKQKWDKNSVKPIKTRTGYLNVSTPEATMLDMVENQRSFGLGRVITIVEELCEKVNKSSLRSIASKYPAPIVQRLGYILDVLLNKKEFVPILLTLLSKKNIKPQYFSLSAKKKGILNAQWQLIVNDTIENNLL